MPLKYLTPLFAFGLAACSQGAGDAEPDVAATETAETEMGEAEIDAMIERQMAAEPSFVDADTLSRDMFAPALVRLDGLDAVEESGDMTALMTDIVVDHPGEAGVQEVYATDGRTIVFMDEAFDTGPVAARETYAEFLPVGPISNRLEYTGARVRCRGEAEFQLEPCT